jgi:hypothetical protein
MTAKAPAMTPNRRRHALVLAVVLLVSVGLAGCRRSSSAAVGRLTVAGQADVTRPGEDRREVTGARDVRVGDRVLVRQGTAEIRLPEDQRLELRPGSDVELQSGSGRGRAKPALMAGDLLVMSGPTALVVGAPGADVTVTGVARMSRGVALLVATYQGSVVVASAGRSITAPALRQAAVSAAGAFPPRPSPLELSAADPWDQRFLSDAIELSNQLAARSQGFSAQLAGTDGRTAGYFRTLFPRLGAEPAFDASLVNPSRPPGDTLVGAAITLQGTRGGFAERWAAVFAFHDDGAPWGLVALDQGVSGVSLLELVEGAIGRSPTTFAEGPPGGGPSSLPAPSGSGSPATTAPRPTATTAPVRRGPAPTTTTTAPPPPTTTPPGPLNTGSPVVDNTVNSLVDTLSGLLRSLGH